MVSLFGRNQGAENRIQGAEIVFFTTGRGIALSSAKLNQVARKVVESIEYCIVVGWLCVGVSGVLCVLRGKSSKMKVFGCCISRRL